MVQTEIQYVPKPKYEVVPRIPFTFEDKIMGRSHQIELSNLDDKIRYHMDMDMRFLDRK